MAACAFLWYAIPTLVVRGIANSSALPAGRIRWDEITGIRMSDVQSQIFLTIDAVDSRRFIERGGALRRLANRANVGMVGSAINISTNGLAISRAELARQLAVFVSA